MKHPVRWSPLVLASALTAVAAGSCSSKSGGGGAQLAQGCSLNSDCANPLVCVFGLCHDACNQTRDCPPGEQCVANGVFRVCLLGSEATCAATTNCPNGLVCGTDHECHEGCQSAGDCVVGGQACSGGSCVDTPDGGGGSSSGGEGGGGSDGSSGGGDGTTGGDSSKPDGPSPPVDAGPLGFVASNVPPGDVTTPAAADAGTVTITTSCTNCMPVPPQTITQVDGSPADLYVVQSFTLDTTATLTFTGPNPVIIASLGNAAINGTISVGAVGTTGGPGGFSSSGNLGLGGGTPGTGAYADSAGGAGGYCGTGGNGGAATGPTAPGGGKYGNATITPLVGGSAGACNNGYAAGGAGGGAIQIVAATSIVVGAQGGITAAGAGGIGGALAGGGSGGAILLEAPTVSVLGFLATNGGGGGPAGAEGTNTSQPASGGVDSSDVLIGGSGSAGATAAGQPGKYDAASPSDLGGGGGGAGWIRVNTSGGSATVSGVVSPDPTTGCFTQGSI
jgi:hypothetical protein